MTSAVQPRYKLSSLSQEASQQTPSLCFLQVPIDPIEKLSGLLDALKLMDAAVQQNTYLEKLLMYRDVRMPELDKVPASVTSRLCK